MQNSEEKQAPYIEGSDFTAKINQGMLFPLDDGLPNNWYSFSDHPREHATVLASDGRIFLALLLIDAIL